MLINEDSSSVAVVPAEITTPHIPRAKKDMNDKEKVRDVVKTICAKLKKSNVPLATGHKPSV